MIPGSHSGRIWRIGSNIRECNRRPLVTSHLLVAAARSGIKMGAIDTPQDQTS